MRTHHWCVFKVEQRDISSPTTDSVIITRKGSSTNIPQQRRENMNNQQTFRLITVLATSFATSATMAGGITPDFSFTADAYGADSNGNRVGLGSGDYAVIDLYATAAFSGLRLLNLGQMDIAIDRGLFQHHDIDAEGNWSASFSKADFGAKNAIDSFLTLGALDASGDPFVALTDPSLDPAMSGSFQTGGGWYNGDPFNGQGDASDSELDIFIGRFVLTSANAAGNTFDVSGTMSYNFGSPGVYFVTDSISVALPGTAVPGPAAASVLAGLAMFRRRRR